jgi:hypothetical protein
MCGLLCAESLTFARWLNEPCRRNIAIITRARVADSGVCVCVCMYASDRGANVRSWGVSACVPELACLAEFVWVCVWLRLGLLFGCIGGVSLLRACVQFRFCVHLCHWLSEIQTQLTQRTVLCVMAAVGVVVQH